MALNLTASPDAPEATRFPQSHAEFLEREHLSALGMQRFYMAEYQKRPAVYYREQIASHSADAAHIVSILHEAGYGEMADRLAAAGAELKAEAEAERARHAWPDPLMLEVA